MRKLDKRGFWMGEESGKFILGVIAVVLLILLMAKLIGIMRTNTKLEQAKISLSEIEKKINTIDEGTTESIFIESPKDWLVWINPKKIEGQNQLCICPQPQLLDPKLKNYNEKVSNSCSEKGVCLTTKKDISISMSCYSNVFNCFVMDTIPLLIFINRDNDKISMVNMENSYANNILRRVLTNRSKVDTIKEFAFRNLGESLFNSDKGVKDMMEQTISEEEIESDIKIERWYLTIAIVNDNKAYLWGDNIDSKGMLCWKGLNLYDFWRDLASISVLLGGDVKKYEKTLGQYCFKGDWTSIHRYVEKNSRKKRHYFRINGRFKK